MKRRVIRRRRGTILIVALVCLAVVMGLLGHLLVGTLRASRELRRQRDLRQCELLLQAGVARAQVQLQQDMAYTGETWNIATEDLAQHGAGRVTIERIGKDTDNPGEIRIVAEYPFGDEHSIRRSQTISSTKHSPTNEE